MDQVRKILNDVAAGVVTNPPTQDEVNKVKERMLRSLEQSMATTPSFVINGLTAPISQGDWRLIFLNHDRLKDVTPADVVRVAKLYFKASNRTIGVYMPDAQPDRSTGSGGAGIEAPCSRISRRTSRSRTPRCSTARPANIEAHLNRAKLANGMKFVSLIKQTTQDRVMAVVELHFGDAASLKGQNAAASMAGSLLMSGTKNKTRQQIQDELQKLDAQVSVSGGGGAGGGGGGRGGRGGGGGGGGGMAGATASITAPSANFAAALRLAAEICKEPAFPQADFDRMKAQRIASLSEAPTEPAQLAQEALSRHLTPFSPTDTQYNPTREEQLAALQKLTLDDVKNFYSKFYGADHGEFAFVGQLDKATVQKLAEELFGSWKSPAPYQKLTTPFKAVSAMNQKIETPDKANAEFEAALRIQLSESDPDYPALYLANYIMGGNIAARVPNRIRNKEGLSYSVNTSLSVPTEGNAAQFSSMAIANPVNMPKVEQFFKEELEQGDEGRLHGAGTGRCETVLLGCPHRGAFAGSVAAHIHGVS